MVKKIFLFFSCIGCLHLTAQTNSASAGNGKDTNQTVITAMLADAPDDSIVTVQEPYTGEWDTTRIKDHRFRFDLPMSKGGSMYILQIGSSGDADHILQTGLATVTYLDSGELHITGRNFNDARYSGSSWVKDWREVYDLISTDKGDGKQYEELRKKFNEATLIGDEDAVDKYGKEGDILDAKLKRKYRNWIVSHPDSRLCGYLITCYLNSNLKSMDSLYNGLDEHAKESRIVRRWKHPGQIDPSPLHMGFDTGKAGNVAGMPKIGTAAPAIESFDVNGNKISLSGFRGKYVLVDFWASWCAPCRAAMPSVKTVYEKYKGKNFEILGVSLDSKKEGWTKAIAKDQLKWVNVSSLKGWNDPAALAYGITAIPQNVLVGPDGNIVGIDLFDDALDKKLGELLK